MQSYFFSSKPSKRDTKGLPSTPYYASYPINTMPTKKGISNQIRKDPNYAKKSKR